jgi:hypothetical protein
VTDHLREPTPAQAQAWSAVRARLVLDAPWLTAGLFRTTPVAAPSELTDTATCDRWGRIYVNFDAENSRGGIVSLSSDVQAAVLNWLSGQAADQPWHASLEDDRFPVVTATEAAGAAHTAAAGLAEAVASGARGLGDWANWAREQTGTAQVPWQRTLGGAVRASVTAARGHQTQSYRRMSRRHSPGVILPARLATEINIANIADISGSVVPDLPTILAELESIVRAVGVLGGNVTTYGVDDEVAWTSPGIGDIPALAPRAGHATDLRPGFAAAAAGARGKRPDLIIAITDGHTKWPERLAARTIVALVGNDVSADRALANIPDWVTVVRVHTAAS